MMHDRIFSIHDLFLAISIAECLLLLVTRLLLPKRDFLEHCILAVFLTFVALHGLVTLVMWNPELSISKYISWQELAIASLFLHLARGLSLFLYVQVLTESSFRLHKKHVLHLIPFIALLLYLLPAIWGADRDLSQSDLLVWYLVKFVPLVYVAAAWILIWRYHKALKHAYSYISLGNTIWLSILTAGFFLRWSWSVIISFVGDIFGAYAADVVGVLHNYILFFLVNGLFIYTQVFSSRLPNIIAEEPSALQSDGNDSAKKSVREKVLHGISPMSLHLEASITVEEFAQKVDLPVKAVSYVINRELDTNFFEFINKHRIEHAKGLLASDTNASIADVLRQSGFNNRSSFHRFFKRIEGVSPSEYKRSKRSSTV